MSYLLACKLPMCFVPLRRLRNGEATDNCAPAPMPVLAVNGTADNVTRYAGDYANEEGWGAYISVSEVIMGACKSKHSLWSKLPQRSEH